MSYRLNGYISAGGLWKGDREGEGKQFHIERASKEESHVCFVSTSQRFSTHGHNSTPALHFCLWKKLNALAYSPVSET